LDLAGYAVLLPNLRRSDQLVREPKDFVGERVDDYKRPKWIEFVSELPKAATGKVQRFKLRQLQVHQDSNGAADHQKSTP